MHGKVKLTKRQIKEDKFATFMLTAKNQLETNWQYYVIGAVAIILAVVAVVYYVNSSASAKVDAGRKYAEALGNANSGNAQVAILTLTQIVDQDADAVTTQQATFMLGRLNLDSRNYPEATRFFEQFTSKYRDDKLMYAAALAGLGACAENQGKFAEAAAKYEQAAQAYPGGPSEGDFLASAMRSYLMAGDNEKARTQLNLIQEKFKASELAQRAERLFSEKGTAASGS
jgi:tetratricopeptide (TPR) repeat protein